MKRRWLLVIKLGLFLSLVLSSMHLSAQMGPEDYQWKLKKDAADIQIYTAKVSGSKYLAVSASMTLEARLDSMVALIMDLDNCAQWAPLCKKAYVQERVSISNNYIYSLNDIPFPGRDRDAVTHVLWEKDSATGIVSMTSEAVEGRVDKVKGVIRIKDATAGWRFTPLANGMVKVESFAHVNPASSMPKWLLNRLLVGSPFKTMKNIRKKMEEGLYEDALLPF